MPDVIAPILPPIDPFIDLSAPVFPSVKSQAYLARLTHANRWAEKAGAPLSEWRAWACHLPPVDSSRLKVKPDARANRMVQKAFNAMPLDTPNRDQLMHEAYQAFLDVHDLNMVKVAAHVISGTVPTATLTQCLVQALHLETHVWRNDGSNLYEDVQWQAHELDAQAVIVGMLLAAGATVDSNVLERAMEQHNPALTALVLHPWSETSPQAAVVWPKTLQALVSRRRGPALPVLVLTHLMNAGFDLHQTLGWESPLSAALDNHRSDVALALLTLGARPDTIVNPIGMAMARHCQSSELIQALIDLGAPVNAQPHKEFGDAPLFSAAAHDSMHGIEALIKAGAHLNAVDGDGRTALFAAAEQGHADVVQALLAAGADPRITPDDRSLVEVARARLDKDDVEEYHHLAVSILETWTLNETLAALNPNVPGADAPMRPRYRSRL